MNLHSTKSKIEIIDIDWDYFIPVDPINLWEHGENKLLMESVWNARMTYLKRLKDGSFQPAPLTSLKPVGKLPKFDGPDWVGIGESHAAAYSFIIDRTECNYSGIEEVVIHHFDLHHDMWAPDPVSNAEIKADNWVRALIKWLTRKYTVKFIWYMPQWFIDSGHDAETFGFIKNLMFQRNLTTSLALQNDLIGSIPADMVFLCRSSGWTPPHLDSKFIDMCKEVLMKLGKIHSKTGLEERAILYSITCAGIDPLKARK